MADKYIVKWQLQYKEKGKYNYRYLGRFSIDRYGLSDYDAMWYSGSAIHYPEAVAEWLCGLLEAKGLYPEMEKV